MLAYPIGPDLLFVASYGGSYDAIVQGGTETQTVQHVNQYVVRHAARQVYGRSEGQKRFVENHLRRI